MNAVEIEEAVSALAERPFEAGEFPFAFLEAFGNKATTIRRLRSGSSNNSDLGGVLQRNNIHIKVCSAGEAAEALTALKENPATARAKAKFALATDGEEFHAEDLTGGDVVVCGYADFPEHFGFFLPLAGITTVRQISESAFDIKATGRLNRLYVELLKENPDWGATDRRHEMNHFMARLIFCFFAEDTQEGRDTRTLVQAGVLRGLCAEFRAIRDEWPSPATRIVHEAELRGLAVVDKPGHDGAVIEEVRARLAAAETFPPLDWWRF